MHGASLFLQNLALVFCVAAVTTVIFHRLRQPVVFGYLLAGMIVGPHLPLPFAADEATVRTLSELGVILLMFSLGLEFSLRRVLRMAGSSGLAALAETSVMMGLGFVAGSALGWTPIASVFAGAIVAISSTTIVSKAFAEHGVRGHVTDVVFGILIVEDLIAILLVALLTAVAAGSGMSAGTLGLTMVRLATFLIALIGAGIVVVPRLVRTVVRASSAEMTLVASVGVCFAGALVALAFGYSVALGAFIAGSLVSESGEGRTIEPLVHPVRDLFVAIFFVSVGMLIDPRMLVQHWGAIAVLVLVVITGKVVAVSVGAFLTGNSLRTAVEAGMSLAQIGEFSFIIAAVGLAAGVIPSYLYAVAIAVSALTTLTTPWLIRAARPAASFVDRKLPKSVQTFVALYGSWIERLREGSAGPGDDVGARLRRMVRLIVLDAALLGTVIIGFAVEMPRFTSALRALLDWPEPVARFAAVAGGVALAVPLVIGLVRMTWRLAFALAVRALPASAAGKLDYARAPRTALVVTLQIAILLAVIAPLTAATAPFLRGLPTLAVLGVAAVVLAFAFWRAAADLQGHARAGAEVIVLALARQTAEHATPAELARTMERVKRVLPGLGEPIPFPLAKNSPAVGRTLAEVNLRGLTGATVLAIARSDGQAREILVPTGHELLREGDVLALAGPREAVAAARELLVANSSS